MNMKRLTATGPIPNTPTRRIAPGDREAVRKVEANGWKLHATVRGEYRFVPCNDNVLAPPEEPQPKQEDTYVSVS